MALEDADLGQRSNREIAKVCKVSHSFVNSTRESLKPKSIKRASSDITSNWPKPEAKAETFPPDINFSEASYDQDDVVKELMDTVNTLAERMIN